MTAGVKGRRKNLPSFVYLSHLLLLAEQSYPLIDHVELNKPIFAWIAHHAQRLAAFLHNLDLLA
jgi:hypothetical protein